jgi:beta-1,4-mannosyl-glycoprotein beta-1,4-N-acetylglucosaminyltransferase
MIVDCFLFYNELDMLHLHLEELYDTVDKFVLVESTTTFVGNEKILYFETNKDRYKKYMDKIIHIVVEDTPKSTDAWTSEGFQRDAIHRGITQLNLKDDDIIIIGDVDEIPDISTLTRLFHQGLTFPIRLEMDMYFYNFKKRFLTKWYSVIVLPYSTYKQYPHPDKLRNALKCGAVKNGGWHLSYFGNSTFISNKLTNFSHQEYNNNTYNDIEQINKCIEKGGDLFGRNMEFDQVQTDYLPINHKLLLNSLA